MDSLELTKARLSRRSRSYRAVFQATLPQPERPWWAFWRRGQDVLRQSSAAVLRDLARYCYANKSTLKVSRAGSVDPIAMAYAEGRRDVYLWITAQLNVDAAEIDAIARMRESDV